MKKKVLASLLFVMFLASLSLVSSEVNESTDQEKISEAYECLADAVEDKCDVLTTEEKIFTVLAVNKCKSELIDDSSNSGQCWPKSNCNIRTTAQAILALDKKGSSTNDAEEWLLSKKETPSEITWYLQITSDEQTTCQIEYSSLSYEVEISEDGIITGNAGPGLSITPSGYWLQIYSTYLDKNFQVSCDESFLTNTLFKKEDSATIHVSPESSSAAAGGITNEQVESFCLAQNGVCNYEANLWAVLALDALDEDIEPYLPYLITLAEDNEKFLPESFLYLTTLKSDYLTTLLSKQIGSKWWATSSQGKFYDTALALYAIQHETVSEKDSTEEWLLDEQDPNGCWNSGNVRDTAFILSSAWPRSYTGTGGSATTTSSCEAAGKYCVPAGICEGTLHPSYDCPGVSSVCCSLPYDQPTCAELGGEVCSSGQVCERGSFVGASDATGRTCCVGDTCKASSAPITSTQCLPAGGLCRTGGCLDSEIESSYTCSSGETCCIPQTTKKSGSYTIVWILAILIVLTVLGILFRDKLRHLLLKVKSMFGKSRLGDPQAQGPRGRLPPSVGSSGPSYYPPRRRYPVERRILPKHHTQTPPRHAPAKPKSGASKELDDVLKKLKDMGK